MKYATSTLISRGIYTSQNRFKWGRTPATHIIRYFSRFFSHTWLISCKAG